MQHTFFRFGLFIWLIFSFMSEKAVADEPAAVQDIVFVILAHVRNEEENKVWKASYQSIKNFYPSASVVVIDDHSPGITSFSDYDDITVIQSEFAGAGELLPYYYFLQHQWATKMVFLHDSMRLKRPFTPAELAPFLKFHWHFSSHQWDEQPVIESLIKHCNHAEELLHYNKQHHLWAGCFGVSAIIDLQLLQQVEEKYQFVSSLVGVIHCRNQRCALELLFAMIMFKENLINLENCSNFGEIFAHPYAFRHMDEETIERVKRSGYKGAIIKNWWGR